MDNLLRKGDEMVENERKEAKKQKKPLEAARKAGLAQGRPRVLLRTFGCQMGAVLYDYRAVFEQDLVNLYEKRQDVNDKKLA